jgi:hypothetical protein
MHTLGAFGEEWQFPGTAAREESQSNSKTKW